MKELIEDLRKFFFTKSVRVLRITSHRFKHGIALSRGKYRNVYCIVSYSILLY